jgi:hypothetical protein
MRYDQKIAYAGTTLNEVSPDAGPVGNAIRVMSNARDFVDRVKALADRLAGPVPEAVGEASPPASQAVLHQIGSGASALEASLYEGHRALERIEALLP